MPTSLNLTAADVVVLSSGTFTGSVNNSGGIICVDTAAAFDPSSINGTSQLFVRGEATLPPLAAVTLATAACTHSATTRATAGNLLRLTGWLGMIGTGFHAWGVHRRMGGWRNWRQNLLAGPPLPAPPAFTGLALAGLAALALLRGDRAR